MLTRRSLLRLFGIGGAAAVVAPSVLAAPVEAETPTVRNETFALNEVTFRGELMTALRAPATPYYDLMTMNSTRRPVFDSLPQFHAPRGKVKVLRRPPD